MSENSDAYITVKVDPEDKAEFEGFVDEDPNTDSLSHLVRKSLFCEVRGDHDAGQQATGAAKSEELGDIKDELRQVRSQLDNLQTTVEAVATRTKEPAEGVKDLTSDIFAVLPEGEEHILEWEQNEIRPLNGHEIDPTAHSGTVRAIANILEEEEYRIQQALDYLREETHRVQKITVEGETRYYKEV